MRKAFVVTVILAVLCFNGVFFLLGGADSTTPAWITFSFVNLALLLPLLVGTLRFRKSDYQASAVLLSCVYSAAELAAGIILLAVSPGSWQWPLALQLVLFSVALAGILAYLITDRR